MMENEYYSMDIDIVYEKLQSSPAGLSTDEVESRKKKYGINVLEEKKPKSKARVFLEQFQDILVMILIASAIISFIFFPCQLHINIASKTSLGLFLIMLLNSSYSFEFLSYILKEASIFNNKFSK